MRYLSLFTGIGGFDLAFDRVGWTCAGQVEVDEHARAVLEHHWPDVPRINDVRDVTGDEFGPVEIVCGGSPCQDVSVAGKGAGLAGERSGLYTNDGGGHKRKDRPNGGMYVNETETALTVGSTDQTVVAFTERTRPDGRTFEAQEEMAYALTNPGSGGRTHSRQIAGPFGVRRLTPVECERLMGLPDGHTLIPAGRKSKMRDDELAYMRDQARRVFGRDLTDDEVRSLVADSHRYRQCGNGVVTNVVEWIAQRINEVESRER